MKLIAGPVETVAAFRHGTDCNRRQNQEHKSNDGPSYVNDHRRDDVSKHRKECRHQNAFYRRAAVFIYTDLGDKIALFVKGDFYAHYPAQQHRNQETA